MASIPVNSEIQLEVEAVLNGIASLDTESLENFAKQVNLLVARRKVPARSEKETDLLKQINTALAEETVREFHALQQKQRKADLPPEEIHRLQELVDQIEHYEGKRLKSLISLAEEWKISVQEVSAKLGIQPPEPNVW